MSSDRPLILAPGPILERQEGWGIWFKVCLYLIGFILLLGAFALPSAHAKVFHSQVEARELAFPGADRFEKKTFVLSSEQKAEVERISRSRLESRLVTLESAWREKTLLGHLHIDIHTVRTQSEGLMVALDSKGTVMLVRVLVFNEPLDYKPSQRWYDFLVGKTSADALRVGHDVDAVTGATLTTGATAGAVRRMLAYYAVLLQG